MDTRIARPVSFTAEPALIQAVDRLVIERRRAQPEQPVSRATVIRDALRAATGAAGATGCNLRGGVNLNEEARRGDVV